MSTEERGEAARLPAPVVPPVRPPAHVVVPPAVSLSAVGLHGAVVPFNPDQDDWSEYVERYFAANDIVSADKQRAILLSAVGPSTYRLIRMLVPTRSQTLPSVFWWTRPEHTSTRSHHRL
jgi:hypothetical protein